LPSLLDYLGRTRRSLSRLSHHLAVGLHHQPTGRSVRRSLTLPPTSWLDCSVFALLPTSWLDCSVLADQSFRPVGWTAQRSLTSWLDYSVLADRSFRPVGWTARCSPTSHSDQLVGLLGARRPAILTSCLGFIISFIGGLAS
jgi:hypothetical protein